MPILGPFNRVVTGAVNFLQSTGTKGDLLLGPINFAASGTVTGIISTLNLPTGLGGITGPAGPPGATGPQGQQGIQGPTGSIGPVGPTGSQGLQGIQGVQGPTGTIGPQGITGPQGNTGTIGATGIQGPTGSIGPQGIQGPTGTIGSTGIQGPTGPAGTNGPSPTGVFAPSGTLSASGIQTASGLLSASGIRSASGISTGLSIATGANTVYNYFQAGVTGVTGCWVTTPGMITWNSPSIKGTLTSTPTTLGTGSSWISVNQAGLYEIDYTLVATGIPNQNSGGLLSYGFGVRQLVNATGAISQGSPIAQSFSFITSPQVAALNFSTVPITVRQHYIAQLASGAVISTWIDTLVGTNYLGASGFALAATGTKISIKQIG